MASKPRNSILYLFDPLESLTTPRRDGSPDSGSSDKENDVQPGEVTVFFNRIYTLQKNVVPKTPNGKLIDLGDTTRDDVWGSADEDVGCAAGASSVAITPDGCAFERRPLADIEIEEASKLSQAGRLQGGQACMSSDEDEDTTPLRCVTVAPTGAPLADVINSVNLSAMIISGSAPPSPLANRSPLPPLKEEADADESDEEIDSTASQEEVDDTVSIPLLITVNSPTGTYEDSNSLTDLVLPQSSESPTDRLFASSTVYLPPATRRPLLNNRIANDDPRRTSVDLHASFSMQMQSAEMSFDLLNDGISFQAGDSMWAGGDDDDEEAFDMAAEMKNMEAAASAYERAQQSQSSEVMAEPVTPMARYSEEENEGAHEIEGAQAPVETTVKQVDTADAPQSVVDTPPKVLDTATPSVPAKSGRSTERARRPLAKMLMGSPSPAPSSGEQSPPPAAIAPVLIPALRIVKKTWRVHGRTDSGTSAGSSTSSASSSTGTTTTCFTSSASSVPSDSLSGATCNKDEKAAPQVAAEPTLPRTVIRGVQRPPAGAEVTRTGVIVPAAPSAQNPARSAAQAKSRASLAREASARFAAAGVQRPNLQQGQRAPQPPPQKVTAASKMQRMAASSTSTMPRSANTSRLPAVGNAGAAARTMGVAGGLKAAAASGIPASRALPRPTSRLPAPSASAKGRVAKTSAPGARVASTGVRRAF